MDKLKRVFTPGGSKDDDIMYGTGDSGVAHGTPEPASAHEAPFLSGKTNLALPDHEAIAAEHRRQQDLQDLKTGQDSAEKPAEEKKEGGVLRQIFNPRGDKYNEEQYGHANAEQGERGTPQAVGTEPAEEKKERGGVLRQIFNPRGNKYNEEQYGHATGEQLERETPQVVAAEPTEDKERGIQRQILNPNQDKYNSQAYGSIVSQEGAGERAPTGQAPQEAPSSTTAAVGDIDTPAKARSPLLEDEPAHDTISSASVKSGVPGPYAGRSGRGAEEPTGGLGAASTLSAAPEVPEKSSERYTSGPSTGDDFGREATTALGLGAATAGAGALATSAQKDRGVPEQTSTTQGGRLDSDGSGVADVDQATYTAKSYALPGHEHGGLGHDYRGPAEGDPTEGYVHQTHGPHATDTANRLDPHIPGEFPTEEGTDRHLGRGAATAAAYEAAKGNNGGTKGYDTGSKPAAQTTADTRDTTTKPQGQPNYGRDAAVATGTGAAGAAALTAWERSQGEDKAVSGTPSSTFGDARREAPVEQPTQHIPSTEAPPTQKEHHFGRDAAVAGGAAGATGLAAHEYEEHKDRKDEVPEQVPQPVPQQQPQSEQPSEHHYGRDAAVAGGAVGAGGLAAHEYEKHRDRKDDLTAPDAGPLRDETAAPRYEPPATETAQLGQPAEKEHHYGRDAAVAGGAAGAAGVGAYEYDKHRDRKEDELASQQPTAPPQQQEQQQPEHHYGRDAAVAGGAAGVGAYAADEVMDEKHEKKLEKAREKEAAKAEKEHEKEVAKAEKQQEKEAAKAEKQHEKEVAKAEKQQEKEAAKAEKQHQKELEKAEKQEGEKKEGFFHRIFHKDKNEDPSPGLEKKERDEEEHRRHQQELAAAAGATGVGAGAVAAERAGDGSSASDPRQLDGAEYRRQQQELVAAGGLGVGAGAIGGTGIAAERAARERSVEPTEHVAKETHTSDPQQLEGSEYRREQQEIAAAAGVGVGAGGVGGTGIAAERAAHERSLNEPQQSGEVAHSHHQPGTAATAGTAGSRPTDDAEYRHPQQELAAAAGVGVGAGGLGGEGPAAEREAVRSGRTNEPRQRMGIDGPIGDATQVSGHGEYANNKDEIVIEPHTGLPMNVGKYGSVGAGGTDGAKNIEGYHETGERRTSSIGTAQGHAPGEQGAIGPDWEKIKKANTPY